MLITFYTEKLKIVLSEEPFLIVEISDKNSGKVFCRNGRQSVTIRSPKHVSDPVLLSVLSSLERTDEFIRIIITDETVDNKASIEIRDSEYGLKFSIKILSSEIIWLSEWKLTGFLFDNVVVPALGGQSLSSDMTPETTLSYKYPFWWNAQFVIGESGGDGLWLHTKDEKPALKLLRIKREEDQFQMSLGFEANAPLQNYSLEAEWYLDAYTKDWRKPVDIHRKWLEKVSGLVPLEENANLPGWLHDINFILELWGMRKDQPEPHHTFDQMIQRIKEWKNFHLPENTLLYLPGFAENGIDSHAPDYNPSERCGGSSKFKELIDTAHEMGYKVMLHTNVLALTFDHRMYPHFEKFRVVDPFNRTIGWGMDIDGDWLPEDYFAYVNPGYKEWGEYMEGVIGELIGKFGPDAIFLDQTLLAFNVSIGPNFLTGMRDHIKRLKEAFPSVLFAGEGLHEQVLPVLPFAQIHGIDSLSEVHGMEGKKSWRTVHPVSTYLFGKYTRFSAHLLTKYPANKMFKLQENAYSKLDVIPALCLYDYKQKMDLPEVTQMVRRAKKLSAVYNAGKKNDLKGVKS